MPKPETPTTGADVRVKVDQSRLVVATRGRWS
jgi:hypothetical protein